MLKGRKSNGICQELLVVRIPILCRSRARSGVVERKKCQKEISKTSWPGRLARGFDKNLINFTAKHRRER
ncbi:MAG: hypothetical protein UZ01_00844 [Candidatus Brocadia sinica]|nr:MAG: hypothetical protein UZ01_00844 [Candidatus Brocadia sinica]